MKSLDIPMATLAEHMRHCENARGALHQLHCFGESIDGFLAPRFVTTLALTLVVLAVTAFIG